MKLRILAMFARLRRRKSADTRGKLVCSDCGCQIHRHERYTIVEARHRDCMDKKLVGQMSMPGKGKV